MIFKSINILLLITSLLLSGCQSIMVRPTTKTTNINKFLDYARAQIGRPYRYGGQSPKKGFDCSGLVFYSHEMTGRHVPRTTGEQYRSSTPIARKNLRPGDLVFFHLRRGRAVSHVGIYLGGGRFLHAPASRQRVSIANLNSAFWSKHFVRGGRFRR